MVNTSWIIRMNNFNRFTFTFFSMSTIKFCHAKSFRKLKALNSSISIDSHSSYMNQMTFCIIFHNRHQYIQSWLSIICVCLGNSSQIFHRIRSWFELSKMNNNIWVKLLKYRKEFFLLDSNIHFLKSYLLSSNLFPSLNPLLNWFDGAYAEISIVLINLSSKKVV